MLADGLKNFGNLKGKFPRWSHDQATDKFASAASFLLMDDINYRNCKSGCFSGTRLRNGQNIIAFQDWGNRFILNVSRAAESQSCQVFFYIGRYSVIIKFHCKWILYGYKGTHFLLKHGLHRFARIITEKKLD